MKRAAYDDDGIWGVGDYDEQAKAEASGFITTCYPDDREGADEAIEALKYADLSDDLLERIIAYNNETLESKVFVNHSDVPFRLNEETGQLVFDEDTDERNRSEDDDEEDEEEEEEDEAGDEPSNTEQPDTGSVLQTYDAGVPSDYQTDTPNLIEQ